MKDLSDPALVDALKARVALLRPESGRLWGTMTPAQAVAHCAGGIEVALGERRPPRLLLGSLIGWLIKPLVLGSDGPLRRNTPTPKGLEVTDDRELDHERERLITLLDRFVAAGPAGCTTHPHSFFGRLTPGHWSLLVYKHLDHHLRQFGV
jgi:hypothetical protein